MGRAKKGENTKFRLLQTAKRIFRDYGYKQSTLALIAKEAEVSLSLLKKYYPRKGDFHSEISRQHALKVSEYVEVILSDYSYENDALMKYLLTINIMFRGIYSDASDRRFHYESIDSSKGSKSIKSSYDYINELYYGIVVQFNSNMTSDEFEARKIQIYGAQSEIGRAYEMGIVDFNDEDRLNYSVSAACILLGVSNFIYATYKRNADKILESIDFGQFKML